MKQFWKWSKNEVSSNHSELIIEGVIASESWYGDEVTPKLFRDELQAHTGALTVRINSPGGDVYAGVSIYNALSEYDGRVTVKVDGMAASIASVIAMAGDEIQMLPGTQMMVHKPWTMAIGNSDDLEEVVAYLKKVGENVSTIYAERTGLPVEKITQLLDGDTWLNPEEAVELGFADLVVQPKKKSTEAVENLLGDMKESVRAAILQPAMSLKTKLEEAPKEEAEAESTTEPAKAEPVENVEEDDESTDTTETTDEVVDNEAEDVSTTETADTDDEAETEQELTTSEKETTEMADATEHAQAQVIAPADQATVAPKAELKNYLKTKDALQDFANVLAANAGADASDVKAAWKSHVSTQMNITNPEVLLPEGVVNAIEDAFKEGGTLWNLVNKTGLDVFKVAWDTVTGEDSRAKGHTRGDEKAEEVITLDDRTVRAQFIYKYLTLDKETVRENRSTGALLRYVLSELPKRIVREIERAIVIGDGRLESSDYKITSFVSLKADAAAANTFASTYTPAVGESHYEALLRAKAEVKADGAKYLVAKSGYLTDLLLENNGTTGGYMFAPGTDLGRALGFAGVVEPDWMEDDAENDAYIFVPSAYRTVGDNSIESFSNFVLKENKNEYLQEIYAGGALTVGASAVAIAETPTA